MFYEVQRLRRQYRRLSGVREGGKDAVSREGADSGVEIVKGWLRIKGAVRLVSRQPLCLTDYDRSVLFWLAHL